MKVLRNESQCVIAYDSSTTENLAVFIWENLKLTLGQAKLLHKVEIFETDQNSVIYMGE